MEEQLLPRLRERPRFRAYHGGFNRAAGRLIAVSLWDTEEHASAVGNLRRPFEELGIEFDETVQFEVTAQA